MMTLAPQATASSATWYVKSLVRSTLGFPVCGLSGVSMLSNSRPTLSQERSASSSGNLCGLSERMAKTGKWGAHLLGQNY
jgi:hypothetical protein